jgi:HD-GYP domain-containing protein (c-di-GMP phosphodiesterase class II)/DNA-binding CsgD family transcriptional regulator
VKDEVVRLADLLAALSVATDLGMGQEPEKAIRACLVATSLARRMDTPEGDVADVYYTALLRHLGCTATAHEEAYLGGDELVSRPAAERADFGNLREAFGLLLQMGRGTGADRIRYLARTLRSGKRGDQAILSALCEVGARLAERLGLGPGVREGLYQSFERWDGKGTPQGLAGEDIGLPARLTEVGHQAVIFDRLGGPESAVEVIRRRGGGWFDPGVAEAFARFGAAILEEIESRDVWEAVLEIEPEPRRTIAPEGLDGLARTFADMVDLKSPFMLGHSSEVADLSVRAASALGLDDEGVTHLRRAALLHDIGRVAVSNGIWEKPSSLITTEWARVLAAADAFQAMTQDRPHRPALPPEAASETLAGEGRSGRLDPECVRAVIDAAGQPVPKVRTTWPANLSDREIEVLRLIARGHSNREIAGRLFISSRTAEHHVQHIYTKIGASTRAAAAMFAMEHGLLRG